jgi:hypothetical protein
MTAMRRWWGKAAVLGVMTVLAAALAASVDAEITQRGSVRVHFDGKLTPKALPRTSMAPIKVAVDAEISSTNEATPPQLRSISIAINRNGQLDSRGLPLCTVDAIQPSTTADALRACRGSLVGEGRFSAKVLLPQQSPFPSDGKVYAFNGTFEGKPAILVHVFGTKPAPTSLTLPFRVTNTKGTFGTVLTASLPSVTSQWGYVTGLSLDLGRSLRHGRSYLSAACPAPNGFPGAVFPFARASFGFADGRKPLTSTVTRTCKVRGR